MNVGILTPVYNRPQTLRRLYDSLAEQSCKDFVWYIIDDGSDQEVYETVLQLKDLGLIEILYQFQENGGKHTALNTGFQMIKEPVVAVVDSDDWLAVNAVETIVKDFSEIENDPSLAGISYLRTKKNGNVVGQSFPSYRLRGSFIEIRYNRKVFGDKFEVFKTEIVKSYPFPVFENEKFLSEAIVWTQIAETYDMIFYNKKLYYCEYLEGGLTSNNRQLNVKNPIGASAVYNQLTKRQFNLKIRIKYSLLYVAHATISGKKKKEILCESNAGAIVRLVFPFGRLLTFILLKKYS